MSERIKNAGKDKKLNVFRDFGDKTSIHALRFVTEETSFWARRLFWFLLFVTCFGALAFQIVDRVIYFYERPVNVKVGVNYNKTLKFPAITICNQNAFKATLATKYEWYKMIEEMFSSHADPTLTENAIYSNTSLEDLYLKTAHEKDDFIFSCTWKGVACKSEDFKKIMTDHGVCFKWNVQDEHVSSPGVENGLKLRLNVEQYEYMPGPHDAAGIKLLIHDNVEMPRVYALGQAVSTGSNVFAGVQLLKINNLPKPHGFCSSTELEYVDTYSQSGCKLDCLSKTAADVCGCRHIYMPSQNGYPPVCKISEYYKCLKQMLEEFPMKYEGNCNCPVPCEFNAYQSDISYASTSMFAADKILKADTKQKLERSLQLSNEITSRMDNVKLNQFQLLYGDFKSHLEIIETKMSLTLLQQLHDMTQLFKTYFINLREACTWKEWLYGYQEYVVAKNFIRPRDAYEERNFHIIALAYNEFILSVESSIRKINDSDFMDKSVTDWLHYQTILSLDNRQEIVRRSIINFTELVKAYYEGIGIFNYTYDFAPRSHNDFAVPAPLLQQALVHNDYAVRHSQNFAKYLNRTVDILEFLKELADVAYHNQSVTEEDIFYGREEFRWLMRNWVFSRSVFYYEVIEWPLRQLQDDRASFVKKCFAVETVLTSIEERIQSVTKMLNTVNSTFFVTLHQISENIEGYFTENNTTKLAIADTFLSKELKSGRIDLENLLQLILNDDSDILSDLDKLQVLQIDIFDTIINDANSFVYYNFSQHSEYLRPWTTVKEEIVKNITFLKSQVKLYETCGEDGNIFLQSTSNLEKYFTNYREMMAVDNEFVKTNFLQLDIFYKQMSYEEITQQKAYDFFSLICDIGGSMGLFLGASLLSVCEIFDLILMYSLFYKRR